MLKQLVNKDIGNQQEKPTNHMSVTTSLLSTVSVSTIDLSSTTNLSKDTIFINAHDETIQNSNDIDKKEHHPHPHHHHHHRRRNKTPSNQLLNMSSHFNDSAFDPRITVGTIYADVTPEQKRLHMLEASINEQKRESYEQEKEERALLRQKMIDLNKVYNELTTTVSNMKSNLNGMQRNQVNWDNEIRVLITQSNSTAREAKHICHESWTNVQKFAEEHQFFKEDNELLRAALKDEPSDQMRRDTYGSTDDFVNMVEEQINNERARTNSNSSTSSGLSQTRNKSRGSSRGGSRSGNRSSRGSSSHGGHSKQRSRSKKKRNRKHKGDGLGFDLTDADPWQVEFSTSTSSDVLLPKVSLKHSRKSGTKSATDFNFV
jgi:hypothetical protein